MKDGKVASTRNDFKRLSALCADMERRYGLGAVEGRGIKAAMPGLTRAEAEKARRTGREGTERAELARVVRAGGHRRRQRSRLRAVAPGRRAGGQAPLRPRRRAWRGRLRGGRGPLRRGVAVFFGGGKLARDLSLPALRDRWRDGEGERQEAAAEWAGDAPTTGVHDVPRPSRHLTHGWAEASERWSKTSLREEHQPSAQHYAGGWRAATQSLGEVVHRLGAVPAEDVATWRAVASDAAGVLAVVLGRLERSPGPLARASGLLARSAQGPRQDAAKPGYVPRGTIKSVAALMAQADLDEDTPTAWRLLLAEVLRVAQAVHDAHLARSESEQAGRLAGEARKALEKARARASARWKRSEPSSPRWSTLRTGRRDRQRRRLRSAGATRRARVGCGQSSSPGRQRGGTRQSGPRTWGGERGRSGAETNAPCLLAGVPRCGSLAMIGVGVTFGLARIMFAGAGRKVHALSSIGRRGVPRPGCPVDEGGRVRLKAGTGVCRHHPVGEPP